MANFDHAGHLIALAIRKERKVRTPQSSIAGNTRPSNEADQCNRKQVQFGCSEIR